MSFSNEWDTIYRNGGHMSVWPWSDLVSLFMRHAHPGDIPGGPRVLELGVGAGANIPFVLAVGGHLSGIDGSEAAIDQLRERFASEPRVQLAVGDFTKENPFGGGHHAVLDRGSITHNDEQGARAAVRIARDALLPGGTIFGLTLFSTELAEFAEGVAGPDPWTRSDIAEGPLAGTGNVHFWDEEHIRVVYADFQILAVEHHSIRRVFPAGSRDFAYWNVVARKNR